LVARHRNLVCATFQVRQQFRLAEHQLHSERPI
jgi:hypothetical protein